MGFTTGQMATASLIGQAGGVASSAIGGYFSAATQKENLRAQAMMAEANARMAERSAQSVLQAGQHEAGRLTMRAGQLKGSQRAALAGSGVVLGEGSAAELQASTDILKDIDKDTLLANAVGQAWGYRAQGVNYQNEALYARANAKGVSPGMQAFGTLLGGATQVASSWYQFKKAGVWDGSKAPVVDKSFSGDMWSPVSWS